MRLLVVDVTWRSSIDAYSVCAEYDQLADADVLQDEKGGRFRLLGWSFPSGPPQGVINLSITPIGDGTLTAGTVLTPSS